MDQVEISEADLILREFFAILQLLQPEGEVAELRRTQVAPATICALYPLDLPELPQALQALLTNAATVWNFTTRLERAAAAEIAEVYGSLAEAHFRSMQDQTRAIFSKQQNFNAMADAFREVEDAHRKQVHVSARRSSIYRTVTDALWTAANLLWLAQHWESLPELRGCETILVRQLAELRASLGSPVPA